ncbi:VOC family protein [Nocardioides caldifontis]|uniref:VOC family protein n=1 Tax=Nocardioides caldifontis TaxID=2588938 RepID=UPI0011E048D6|nr:VOC family protein [Nocardioides caldifontis]
MASRLNPYLSFHDTAREAMEFYQSVFGGELQISTFGEYGGAPEGLSDNDVMHAMLKTDSGFVLMASDTPGDAPSQGTAISVSLSGTDEAELTGYWEKLSSGGTVTMPFEKQMWGDTFGMCVDKFGVPWMVDVGTGD